MNNGRGLVKDIIESIHNSLNTLITEYKYQFDFKNYKTKELYFLKIYIDDLYAEGKSKASSCYLTNRLKKGITTEYILSIRQNVFEKDGTVKDCFLKILKDLDKIFIKKIEIARKNECFLPSR